MLTTFSSSRYKQSKYVYVYCLKQNLHLIIRLEKVGNCVEQPWDRNSFLFYVLQHIVKKYVPYNASIKIPHSAVQTKI